MCYMKELFELTKEDWIAFNKYAITRSGRLKKVKVQTIFYMTLTMGVLMALGTYWGKMSFTAFVLMILCLILWIIIFLKNFQKRCLKQIDEIFNEKDRSTFLGKHEVIIDDDVLIVKEPGSEYKTKWASVCSMEENPIYIYIYITPITACILPKSKLKNYESVRNLLIKKIPKEKQHLRKKPKILSTK